MSGAGSRYSDANLAQISQRVQPKPDSGEVHASRPDFLRPPFLVFPVRLHRTQRSGRGRNGKIGRTARQYWNTLHGYEHLVLMQVLQQPVSRSRSSCSSCPWAICNEAGLLLSIPLHSLSPQLLYQKDGMRACNGQHNKTMTRSRVFNELERYKYLPLAAPGPAIFPESSSFCFFQHHRLRVRHLGLLQGF